MNLKLIRNLVFPVKTVTDAIDASDIALINKTAVIADAVSLADYILVNKVLQITETINLVETIQVGVEGVKKNKAVSYLGRRGGAAYRRVGNLKFEKRL